MNTMNIHRIGKHLRIALNPSARALAVAAGLAAASVQAVTTTSTYDLGTSPAATTIDTGVSGLLPWIAKGALPPGSILRSVSVNAKIEAAPGDSFASDICAYIDPSPDAPGTAALLQVGGSAAIGTAPLTLGWANGGGGPPATVIDTKTAASWSDLGDIDLSTVQLSVGNDYSSASWSGTITVEYDVPEDAAILTFGPGAVVGPLVGNAATIAWIVPSETDVTTLAPTFTLSSGTCDRVSGGTYDFTNPVIYIVTDGPTVNTYTVTVTAATTVVWNLGSGGAWDTTTENWTTDGGSTTTTFANGDQVLFDNTAGGTIAIAPDMSPLSTTVSAESGTYSFVGGPITTGSLIKDGGSTLAVLGVVEIPPTGAATPLSHTYSGGTTINGGTLTLGGVINGISPDVIDPVGTGPVTLNNGTLYLSRVKASNDLIVNGGKLYQQNGWGATWSGPITLNATLSCDTFYTMNISGDISGTGGLTKTLNGPLNLTGTNSYTGPTSVTAGTLQCTNPDALGSGDLSVSSGAKLNLNYAGTKAVASLTLGGVPQTATGTYGSLASDAIYKSAYFDFAGVGTVTVGDPATAAYIISFGANVSSSSAIIGTVAGNTADIEWIVPIGTNPATLAPEFVLSGAATCSDQTSGAIPTPGFDAGPVVYTIVSEDSSVTNVYTVSVTVLQPESTLIWNIPGSGDWNFTTPNWLGQTSGLPTPYFDGVDVVFDNTAGGTITIDSGVSPLSTTVSAAAGTYIFDGVLLSGSLTKDGAGTLNLYGKVPNPYSGGTIINDGTLLLGAYIDGISLDVIDPVGTGPVTLNNGTLYLGRVKVSNALIVNGGKLYQQNGWGATWSGPITLNATLSCDTFYTMSISGDISGTGGLTKTLNGPLNLSGTNSYTGPTSVTAGTFQCNSPAAVASGDWSITGGKVNLNYTGTKAIASLTLGGSPQTVPGTYGSTLSGADYPDDTYFTDTGTGTVTVGGGSGYADWATLYAGSQTPGEDYNKDGVQNGIAYFMGMNGLATNPSVVDGKVTWPHVGAVTSFEVQVSDNLGSWVPANPGDVDTSTPGLVIFTLPTGEPKKFCRLTVTP